MLWATTLCMSQSTEPRWSRQRNIMGLVRSPKRSTTITVTTECQSSYDIRPVHNAVPSGSVKAIERISPGAIPSEASSSSSSLSPQMRTMPSRSQTMPSTASDFEFM